MTTPGSKVIGFTPGQIIGNGLDRAFKFPRQTEKLDVENEQKAFKQTINTEYREGFGNPGQLEEMDLYDGQKTPVIHDAPSTLSDAWADDTEKRLKERKTRRKLDERDQSAVEYSKSLLDEGDTLVYVSYPGGITFYDSNGFVQPYKIHRVSSEKLKALGSPKFSRMFEERPQYWARKRKSLLHHLPEGVKYILDLTPPEEGDEAVELVSELSCSAGIRNWHSAEKRCGAEKCLVAGDDEVSGPANLPVKAAKQFRLKRSADGHVDAVFGPLDSILESAFNNEFCRTSLGRLIPKQSGSSFRDGTPVEMQKAMKTGSTSQDRTQAASKKDVLDYCPIRHRFGVENLLRIIQGKVPKLDSAPKVWTLFVLAKYYECPSVVIDYITSWIMTGSNIQFLEILPEASLNIGLGLKIPMITRTAFSILVSEEALNVASRTLCKNYADRRRSYRYIRPREELDEDLWNVIQHASQDFCDRIQETITDLLDERMAWFLELPEYRKICKFEDYCYKKKDQGKKEEALYEKRKSVIQKLLINLRGYVRGRIVICLNQGLSHRDIAVANHHQRELQWEFPETGTQEGPDTNYIYDGLGECERVMLPYFWRSLQGLDWDDGPMESPELASCSPQLLRSGKSLVDRDGICNTNTYHLDVYVRDFNHEINLVVETENYHSSSFSNVVPTISTLPPLRTKSMDEEKTNYAFMSAYNPDHAYHQARLAGIRALELELAEFDGPASDAASISSVTSDTSTKPLLDLPLRPKKNKTAVEPGKNEHDFDTKSGLSAQASHNRKGSATKLLDSFWENSGHKPGARDQAYKANPITKTSSSGLETDSPLLTKDNFSFDTSELFLTNSYTNPNEPVEYNPHKFNLSTFLDQLNHYVDDICTTMLSKPDGSEFTMLTDTLLCLTDNEWQYLPLWAGGNDDGSGGVTSADVPPAYYSNVGGLTPGVQYKGVAGFVGVVGSSVNTSLDVRDGSTRSVTLAGSEFGGDVGSEEGSEAGVASGSYAGSIFSADSYDMAVLTPTGSGSESEFEIISHAEDEESGDDFTIAGDSVSDKEISDVELDGDRGEGKEKVKDDEHGMDWTDQEDLEDNWEGSFTDD
ncbi:hypothetical protein SBOR_5780 [Sclerotinia borealis F-4128]|uniref:Uncharacterized protein n=1 Tax=Sclerotinia borealis (strain F-4128) TaxID=1432307 RepID=W9CGI2_SCLBF|nr:hypothetical protein SBOR_5780 [Sclerotinia borealis F-4128]